MSLLNTGWEGCYGNASTWKRLNTEMPQKKAETPQKFQETPQNKEETPQKLGFEGFPFFLQKLRKRLKKLVFEGFLLFFEAFPC